MCVCVCITDLLYYYNIARHLQDTCPSLNLGKCGRPMLGHVLW